MKENIIYFTKLSAKALIRFVLLFGVGYSIVLIFMITEIIHLLSEIKYSGGGHAGEAGVLAAFFAIFVSRPTGAILWSIGGFGGFALLHFFVSKHVYATIIHRLISDKSLDSMNQIIDRSVDAINLESSYFKGLNYFRKKKELLASIKQLHAENVWFKRVTRFALKRINFTQDDLVELERDFKGTIKTKINHFLLDYSQPTLRWFWLFLLAELVIFLIIFYTHI